MNKVINIVKNFYSLQLPRTKDFEDALLDCEKEELVEFIMHQQSRGVFSSWQDYEVQDE